MDDYSIILLNEPPNGIQRIIWLDVHGEKFTINEHILPIGYFEKIAREFLNQVFDFLRDVEYDLRVFDEERKRVGMGDID